MGCTGEYVQNCNPMSFTENVDFNINATFAPGKEDAAAKLKTELEEACSGLSAKIDVSVKMGCGDKFSTIKNVGKVYADGFPKVDITHEPGTVMLIDFWATWCPPCQRPMAHNQEMLKKNAEAWGGKVRILGLSIDGKAEDVKRHVDSKGWTDVEHYHVRNGVCTADKVYGVQGVPFCALVDTNGVLVFAGHPAHRNFEDDFAKLLDGKTITGKGTIHDDAGDEDGADAGSSNQNDAEVIQKFKDGLESFKSGLSDDHKGHLSKLARGFLVLVQESKLDTKTFEMKSSYTHFQVMMGPGDSVDTLKAQSESLRQESNPWKTNLREQKM